MDYFESFRNRNKVSDLAQTLRKRTKVSDLTITNISKILNIAFAYARSGANSSAFNYSNNNA